MAKNYPKDYFVSYEEYETYFTCLSKAQPGDKVVIYFRDGGPTWRRSELTREVVIVGRRFDGKSYDKFSQVLLLGSNDDDIGFWTLTNSRGIVNISAEEMANAPLVKDFKNGYWAYFDELRIAKIIKIDR